VSGNQEYSRRSVRKRPKIARGDLRVGSVGNGPVSREKDKNGDSKTKKGDGGVLFLFIPTSGAIKCLKKQSGWRGTVRRVQKGSSYGVRPVSIESARKAQ